jgi:hypothetical protein
MTQQISPPQPSQEQIDDLLYFARTGDTDDLLRSLAELKQSLKCSELDVMMFAMDEYSGNSVLHMTAGNGHLGLRAICLQ